MQYMLRGIVASALFFVAMTTHAATRTYTLFITSGSWTINNGGGTTLPVWTYTDVAGAVKVSGPVLTANEGDTVTISVTNNHTINHNFVIKGVTTDATAITPGGTRTYSFTASKAGTYLYYDTLNSNINREMGMYGMLWVGPSDGSQRVWTNGPTFDFQRLWVVSDMDKTRWNDVAASGGTVNTAVYKPNYFMNNGKGGLDAKKDPAITIDGGLGQTALIRIVNAGQFAQSLHFHANHLQVVRVDNVQQSAPYKQLDVINVPPGTTADVLFYLNQLGDYVLHNHTAQMETANGFYLNGVATMINIR